MRDVLTRAIANRQVNTREFCLGLASKVCSNEDEVLGLAFELYDTDHSGSIDQAEYADLIRSVLKSLGDQQPVCRHLMFVSVVFLPGGFCCYGFGLVG